MKFLKKFITKSKRDWWNRPGEDDIISAHMDPNHWLTYKYRNIELKIQPGYITDKYVSDNIKWFLTKIEEISKKYFLVKNGESDCELYRKRTGDHDELRVINIKFNYKYSHHIKFRLSDSEDNTENSTKFKTTPGEIPRDISSEMISFVKNKFSNFYVLSEEFHDRGYILFDVMICGDNWRYQPWGK